MLAPDLHHEPAVGGLEPVHDEERAETVGSHAHRPEVHHEVGHGDHRVEHRDVDVLALAGAIAVAERGEDADGGEERARDVAEGAGRRDEWRLSRLLLVVVEAGHRFGDRCVRRPRVVRRLDRVPEARHRRVDDRRVDGEHVLVGEAELLHRPGAEVLRDDVVVRRERQEQLPPLGLLEVDADAALVEGVPQEGRTDAPPPRVGDRRQGAPAGLSLESGARPSPRRPRAGRAAASRTGVPASARRRGCVPHRAACRTARPLRSRPPRASSAHRTARRRDGARPARSALGIGRCYPSPNMAAARRSISSGDTSSMWVWIDHRCPKGSSRSSGAVPVELVLDRADLVRTGRDRLRERRVDVGHVDRERHRRPADGLRAAGVHLGVLVGEHHGRVADLDLGVADLPVRCGDPVRLGPSNTSQ